jgi:predicted alpha/beta superfamily hydrolase
LSVIERLPYNDWHGSKGYTVGQIDVWPLVYSPQLDRARNIVVWLPPSYATSTKTYPVLYMHDGQNLFDRATSFAGVEWQVDETLTTLANEGIEAIVVGLWNTDARIHEYNPFPTWRNGTGKAYVDFIIDTLKPMMDEAYRTSPTRAQTGIMGSSMGGLISTYAFFTRPDVFGVCGAMSPSYWVANGAIHALVQKSPKVAGRIYLDHGTRENSPARMCDILLKKGYRLNRDLTFVREEDGEHNEAAWARRLPDALRFLLK